MAKYKLLFKKSVARDLRALPNGDVRKILRRIDALADDPRAVGCQKLSGREFYRVRQGAYRIVYGIIDDQLIVHIIKVGHRSKVYQ
jgi:mRNA interferase RelE/StbE